MFSTEIMRWNQSGSLPLKGANTSANGTGITFPATQSASTDANTLDDYEEGTWSIAINGVATGNTGRYVKIGNICTVHIDVQATPTANGSNVSLPFTAGASHGALAIGWSSAAQAKSIYVKSSQAIGVLTAAFGTNTSNLANGERIIIGGSYVCS